jgi:class 3 adenylate cyclase
MTSPPGLRRISGTVTFLFRDIEGSTLLLRRLGTESYAQVLADHHRIIRSALMNHGGNEVNTQGDGFFRGVQFVDGLHGVGGRDATVFELTRVARW